MKKTIDITMIIITFLYSFFSSIAFATNGFIRGVPPTDANIMIISVAAFTTVSVSNWKSFYVDKTDTIISNLVKSVESIKLRYGDGRSRV